MLGTTYDLVDSMMIGKFLGSEAFAATATTAPLVTLINAGFWGYLTGVAIFAAVLYGSGETQKLVGVVKINMILSAAIAVIISGACLCCKEAILTLLKVSEELKEDAWSYFGIYISGMVMFQFGWGSSYVLSYLGDTNFPFLVSGISGICNVILNYLFLVPLKKGVGGCAAASVISAAVSGILLWRRLGLRAKEMNVKIRGAACRLEDFKHSVAFALPNFVQQLAMYAGTAIISPLTNSCAPAAISGLSVANKIKQICANGYTGSNKANTAFTAQVIGAQRKDLLKKGMRIGALQTAVIFSLLALLCALFPDVLTSLMLSAEEDAEAVRYSILLIRIFAPLTVFKAANNFLHGVFKAAGAGELLAVSTGIYTVCLIVISKLLYAAAPAALRIYALALAMVLADGLELVFSGVVFCKGKWKKQWL